MTSWKIVCSRKIYLFALCYLCVDVLAYSQEVNTSTTGTKITRHRQMELNSQKEHQMSKIRVGVIGAGGIVRRLHLPDLNQNDNFVDS